MSMPASHIPAYEMEMRSKRKEEERERQAIWKRCERLLNDENSREAVRDANDTAVLGYN